MVFSSLLFLYAFFAVNMALYYIVKNTTYRNTLLLIFSLVFYSFGGPKYLLLLVGMTFISYIHAIVIVKAGEKTKASKIFLALYCVWMLGLLGFFKYFMFIAGEIQRFTGFPENIPEIVLPIGISFYTFQLISYVVDVYRGDVKAQKNFFWLLLYSSLYHQCIAGPIVRYEHVNGEIMNRTCNLDDIVKGIKRFAVGLFKKVILANSCALIADTLAPAVMAEGARIPVLSYILGIFAYTLQIYLDFSAYSDMAIGMGLMVGFHYRENFNYPYTAKSVTDFWRRWHISLSSFFRDYVYIPLGGSRNGVPKMILSMVVVWFLTGFWHGASWNFILWGLYYLVFLLIEKILLKNIMPKIPTFITRIYTLIVVYFGWILFRYTDLKQIGTVLKGIFAQKDNLYNIQTSAMFKSNMFILAIAVIACLPVAGLIKKGLEKLAQKEFFAKSWFNEAVAIVEMILVVAVMVICTAALVGDTYNPFLYFRF